MLDGNKDPFSVSSSTGPSGTTSGGTEVKLELWSLFFGTSVEQWLNLASVNGSCINWSLWLLIPSVSNLMASRSAAD